MIDILVFLHEILCALIVCTVFFRQVQIDESVLFSVRLAFFFLGLVACLGIAAPLAWGFMPNLFSLALLASIAFVQWVTGTYWNEGVPYCFYKPDCRPLRRSTDMEVSR